MKTIFITGGARGIGLETARLFLEQGWEVAVFDLDKQALDNASKVLSSNHYHAYCGDILDTSSLEKALVDFTESSKGILDVLHNNAGIVEVGEFDSQPIETHLSIVDINLKGIINSTYVALPFLKKSESACIVNMSSASALYGNPEITVYAATKSAIKSLTEAWNIAFRKYNIRCTDLIPIYVRTRMVDDHYQKYRKLQLKDVKLTAPMVARSVWKAVNGKQIHYYLGLDTKVYARLLKWLPESWLPVILKKVLGYKD
jgi:short-subunit dehydrogenase